VFSSSQIQLHSNKLVKFYACHILTLRQN